ncbi:MAG: hypothetical protein Q9197_002156 [Variospora fuerteventurae]
MTDLQPSSPTKMARSDSGFASYHSGVEPTYRPMRPSRTSSPTSFSASHHPTPQLVHRYHRITIQRPPRAITTSRQNSTSAPIRSSNPSSRSSSFVITRPPSLHIRSHHRTRSECTNPYAFHRQCASLFSSPPSSSLSPTGTAHIAADDSDNTPPSQPQPTTSQIYWLLPSTRHREYAAIEAETSGVKGLWRRWAPRRWQRGRMLGFSSERRMGHFAGDKERNADSDGGSVRRYRVDVDVDGGEIEGKENEGSEEANGETSGVGGWSVCFGRKG